MAKAPQAITDMSTLARVIFDIDTIPPSVPSNVVGTPFSSSRIDLSWAASVDTGGSGLAGYLLYRGGVQVATPSGTSFSDTGLTASTGYQYQVAAIDAAGNISAKTTAITVTTQASTGPAFAPVQPAAAFVGIAGVRTYTDATQQAAIGRFNLFVLGVSWEGWSASGRDLEVIVKAIKTASTAQNGTVLLNYLSLNGVEEDSGDGMPTYTAEVAARNWRLYNVGSSGTLTPPNSGGSATALVNYSLFVPQNPSGEHPYDFGAKYSYNLLLTKTRTDARFTGFAAGMGSPSLDGVYQDNFLCDPRVNGDWNLDGTPDIGNTLPCAATPWLQAGQLRYVQTMRSLAPSKFIFVNGGDYGLVDPGVMSKQVDGLLAESYMGKSFSYDSFKPFTTMLGYYYAALAAAANPRMVVFGGSWPDTNPNGTALVRLPTSGGFPPLNTQWQWARYIAATAYLGEGMPGINRFSQGYSSDLAALDWYDFFGGVNSLARGWIGAPKDTLRPTTPKIAKGPIGIFGVEYANAMVLVNPVGNGSQTVVASDIPGNWKFLTGTQDATRDSGAVFSSVTMPERDGLFLQRAAATGQLAAGHWQAAKLPMRLVYPQPDTSTQTFARHHKAYYDGANPVEYRIPVGVQYGALPLIFKLLPGGPAGMTIGQADGSANYGEIVWTPTASVTNATVSVQIIDQAGATLTISWTVSTSSSTSDFIFVSTSGNDSTGTGSISAPYKTLNKVYGTSAGASTFPNRNLYLRAGTYATYDATSGGYGIELAGGANPIAIMGFPGEAVTLNLAAAGIVSAFNTNGSLGNDLFLQNFTFSGGPASSGNFRICYLGQLQHRQTFHNVAAPNVWAGTAPSDNATMFYFNDGGEGVYRNYIYIKGCSETNRVSGNSFGVTSMFVAQYVLVENCSVTGSSGQVNYFFKASCADVTCRYTAGITPIATYPGGTGCQGNGLPSKNYEFAYCTFAHPSGDAALSLNIQAGACGQHWVYRCTIRGSINCESPTSNGPFTMENNVIQTTGFNPVLVNYANVTLPSNVTNTGTECQGSSGIIDANNLLTGASRTNFLGQRGAEIG